MDFSDIAEQVGSIILTAAGIIKAFRLTRFRLRR